MGLGFFRFLLFCFKLAQGDPWCNMLRDFTWMEIIRWGNIRWTPSVPIQNCEGFVLFINCFKLVYFEHFADFPFVHVWWNAYCFRMQPVELSMGFFCIFCSPRWFPFPTHATLLMFYASCKNPLFWLANIDSLVVVLICFFEREFVVDFFKTWRRYLYLVFLWTQVFFFGLMFGNFFRFL